MQRLTAVALVLLGSGSPSTLLALPDFSYRTVYGWVHRPLSSILLICSWSPLAYHSYLGLQVVIEDYVNTEPMKVVALLALGVRALRFVVAALFAILKVAFGPAVMTEKDYEFIDHGTTS